MTRFASFLSLALFAASLPGGLAGPACSRKHYKATDCILKCRSKWGWSGGVMGSDPWGIVLQNSEQSLDAALSKACGTELSNPGAIQQPVANVQTGSVILPSSTSTFVAPTTSPKSSVSPAGFAPVSSVSSKPPKPSTTSSKPAVTTTSVPPPPQAKVFAPTTTRAPVAPTTTFTPKPAPVTTKAAPAPPPPAPAPQAPASSSGTSGSDIDAYLSSHNSVRARHGASPLTWSDDLASKAQQWANGCLFQHSGGIFGRIGENLAAGTGPNYSIQTAVKSWTDEVTDYNPTNPKASHFTQVVWKASTQVGCAVQSCDGIFDASAGKARYYVCEYSPAGNVNGQFAQNVQA